MSDMMMYTLREVETHRIARIRRPIWACPHAYMRVPLLKNGGVGPWYELYDDEVQKHLGLKPGSQKMLSMQMGTGRDWLKYDGPVSPHEKDQGNYGATYAEE